MPKTLPVGPFKVPAKPGRPRREAPYLLPPLPPKKSKLSIRQKIQQKVARAVQQNNAASARYRRSQSLKQEQQQLQLKQVFQRNASLHIRQAKLKGAVDAIGKKLSQLADQGCTHCVQMLLLLPQSPSHPMVKIEPEALEDLKEPQAIA